MLPQEKKLCSLLDKERVAGQESGIISRIAPNLKDTIPVS